MKKMIFALGAALLVVLTWTVFAQVQSRDTAKDPVCGMTVNKSTAKYTYDYKGSTHYFCSEGCKTSFSKEPEKYLAKTPEAKPGMMGQGGGMGQGMGIMHGQQGSQLSADLAIDPVCEMAVRKSTAKYTYGYKGSTYYFCSEGCKTSFSKDPEKSLAKIPALGRGGICALLHPDVEKKFENTKTGVIITLTSKNAEIVKTIQDHAAMMKDGKCAMMGKDAAAKEGQAACPMGANCPMKKR